jgi:hypothetical protein
MGLLTISANHSQMNFQQGLAELLVSELPSKSTHLLVLLGKNQPETLNSASFVVKSQVMES